MWSSGGHEGPAVQKVVEECVDARALYSDQRFWSVVNAATWWLLPCQHGVKDA